MSLMAVVLGLLMQVGLPFPGPGGVVAEGATGLARQAAKASVNSSTGGGLAVVLGSNELAGSELIGVCGVWSGSITTTMTATDTAGNTWTAVGNTPDSTVRNHSNTWVLKAPNSIAGANTVTFVPTFSGAHLDCAVLEYASATTVAQSNFPTAVNPDTLGVTPSVTTSQQNVIIAYAFVAAGFPDTYTGTTGYTREVLGAGTSANDFQIFDKANVAAGTISITFTGNTGNGPLHAGMIAVH